MKNKVLHHIKNILFLQIYIPIMIVMLVGFLFLDDDSGYQPICPYDNGQCNRGHCNSECIRYKQN